MGRYIPPALRSKASSNQHHDSDETVSRDAQPASSEAEPPRSLAALSLDDDKRQDPTGTLYTVEEVHDFYIPTGADKNHKEGFNLWPRSTLNNSIDLPQGLTYVMLFPRANPKWDGEALLYAKSNLNLLPGFEEVKRRGWLEKPKRPQKTSKEHGESTDGTIETEINEETRPTEDDELTDDTTAPLTNPTNDPPFTSSPTNSDHIPIFKQIKHGHRTVQFVGYYAIETVTWLPAHSKALVNMLEVKFGGSIPDLTASEDVPDNPTASPTTSQDPRSAPQNARFASQDIRLEPGYDKSSLPKGPKSRSSDAWVSSLSRPWGVVKMKLMSPIEGDEEGALAPPAVEAHPEEDWKFRKAGGRGRGQDHRGGYGRGNAGRGNWRGNRNGGRHERWAGGGQRRENESGAGHEGEWHGNDGERRGENGENGSGDRYAREGNHDETGGVKLHD